jgi:hypothetical protein
MKEDAGRYRDRGCDCEDQPAARAVHLIPAARNANGTNTSAA